MRQDRRIERHRVGAVDAVAAGAARENHAHAFGFHSEDRRDAAAHRVCGLRRRPDRRLVRLHVGDGAGGAHRRVHLVRMQIRRFEHRRRRGKFLIDVAGIDEQRVARRFLVTQMIVEIVVARESDAGCPGRLQRARCLHRLPRFLTHDTDEILLDDDLDESWQAPHRRFVDADERRADRRRTHDAAMHHAWHTHVVDEFERAGRDRGHVEPRRRRSERRPLARRLALRGRAQCQVEFLSANQLAVGDAFVRRAFHRDGAVRGDELIDRHRKSLCGQSRQRFACGRARLREVALVEVGRRRLASRRRALVECHRGVALNQLHTRDRHRQFLSNELRLRRQHTLSEFGFAGVRSDAAVGGNGEPGVDLPADARVLRPELPLQSWDGGRSLGRRCVRKTDDHYARLLEKFATGGHADTALEYFLIARIIRGTARSRAPARSVRRWPSDSDRGAPSR